MLNMLLDATAEVSIKVTGSKDLISTVMGLVSKFALVGGALWAIWGIIILAGALKDKNGPALQAGIWQLVGGALILVAGMLFTSVITFE